MSTRALRVMEVLEATRGGTRRHLNEVVSALETSEFELHVVCAVRRDPTFRDDVEAFRRCGHETSILPMTRGFHPFYDPAAVWRLRRLLRRRPCDVLHLHSAKAGFLGRLAARGAPCRVVYSPHAFPFLQRSPLPIRGAYRFMERVLAPRTDILLAVSQAEGRLAVETGLFPADRVRVLPNAVDVAALGREAERWSVPPSRPGVSPKTFALVGELRTQKGPLLFLDAARRLEERGIPARFLLPERGPQLGKVRRYLERHRLGPRVELVPAPSSLMALYEQADVAVLPSLWEGLPYAVLDALALGRPVITSSLPVFEDLLGTTSPQLLFPPDDSRALAQRMELCCRLSRSELATLGAQGRGVVLERHGMAAWKEALREIYRSAAPAGRGPDRSAGPS